MLRKAKKERERQKRIQRGTNSIDEKYDEFEFNSKINENSNLANIMLSKQRKNQRRSRRMIELEDQDTKTFEEIENEVMTLEKNISNKFNSTGNHGDNLKLDTLEGDEIEEKINENSAYTIKTNEELAGIEASREAGGKAGRVSVGSKEDEEMFNETTRLDKFAKKESVGGAGRQMDDLIDEMM